MTHTIIMFLIDAVAIAALVFMVYYPRHRRSDLVVAFLGVNIGVFAVTEVLASTSIGLELGFGLFGVLSIIRLRSSEISQREVAYYFAALALGLIAGLSSSPLGIALMVAIVAVLALADNKGLYEQVVTQHVQLDRAITHQDELVAELEELLDAEVLDVHVIKLDLVNDLTACDVRWRGQRRTTPADIGTQVKHEELISQ